jgi:hypothetical protein
LANDLGGLVRPGEQEWVVYSPVRQEHSNYYYKGAISRYIDIVKSTHRFAILNHKRTQPTRTYRHNHTIMTNLTILSLALTLFPSSTTAQHNLFHRQQSPNATSNACQTVPNQNTYTTSEILSQCGNATLFNVWRPKARFIAPEGWMNGECGCWTILIWPD